MLLHKKQMNSQQMYVTLYILVQKHYHHKAVGKPIHSGLSTVSISTASMITDHT